MKLITTKKAAELLRITPVRVRQLIQEGQLSSVKEGRDHLLDEMTVKTFDQRWRRSIGRPRKDRDKK
jgi:excisionase family DNA binding protein